MKMTVVTVKDGTIVGFMHSSALEQKVHKGQMHGGLVAGPDQQVHEIDVPDEFAAIEDGEELHTKLKAHMSKKTK